MSLHGKLAVTYVLTAGELRAWETVTRARYAPLFALGSHGTRLRAADRRPSNRLGSLTIGIAGSAR